MNIAFNIDRLTKENNNFRRVISTTKNQQLVIMSVDDLIPMEIHEKNDQFIKIEFGKCEIIVDKIIYKLNSGDSITIPAGSEHEIINKKNTPLKLYTIYSPPHHPKNLIQKDRL